MIRVTLQVGLKSPPEVQSPGDRVRKCKGTGVETCLIRLGDSRSDSLVVTGMESLLEGVPGMRPEKWEEPDLHHVVGPCGDLDTYSIDCFEQRGVRTILATLLETDCCGVCMEKQGDQFLLLQNEARQSDKLAQGPREGW